jgi:hypothetical protein
MVDRYAGTNFEAACDAWGDADMRQVPSMKWLLTMIDRANENSTSYGTGTYATQQAVTKPTVDEATRSLILNVRWIISGGAPGCIAYSVDGITWKNTPLLFSSNVLRSSAYGDGKWISLYKGGKLAYSTNGITWTLIQSNVDIYPSRIIYADNKFVGVNNGFSIVFSINGIDWTKLEDIVTDASMNTVAYGNNKFLIITHSKIISSTNGVDWNIRKNSGYFFSGFAEIYATIYHNNTWIVTGTISTSTPYKHEILHFTADLTTWNKIAFSPEQQINAIAYGKSKFVAVGNNGYIIYSMDGVLWTKVSDSKFGTTNIQNIIYANNKFIAVGSSGKMAYSEDGVSWNSSTFDFKGSVIYSIVYKS